MYLLKELNEYGPIIDHLERAFRAQKGPQGGGSTRGDDDGMDGCVPRVPGDAPQRARCVEGAALFEPQRRARRPHHNLANLVERRGTRPRHRPRSALDQPPCARGQVAAAVRWSNGSPRPLSRQTSLGLSGAASRHTETSLE